MLATTKNTLSLKTTDGKEVTAVWPSCGASILATMVDFSIGTTSTTRSVRTLFPENKMEKLFWGHEPTGYSLWQENRLSPESMEALRTWLNSREMPDRCVAEPYHVTDFIKTAKELPEPPEGFPTTFAELAELIRQFKTK
jgi:hypothetical protein